MIYVLKIIINESLELKHFPIYSKQKPHMKPMLHVAWSGFFFQILKYQILKL
jgi:hypothetical protein